MSDGKKQSDLLHRLYQIEDNDSTGIYAQAKLDLEKAKIRNPHVSVFDLCRNASESDRKYVARRFVEDGLQARAMDIENWNCGDTSWDYVVRVEIPRRTSDK